MDIDEEKMWRAYSAHLDNIAEDNVRRAKTVLDLKCNLLMPLLTTDKSKLLTQIKALEEELNGNTSYENKAVYKDIIGILQRLQVA